MKEKNVEEPNSSSSSSYSPPWRGKMSLPSLIHLFLLVMLSTIVCLHPANSSSSPGLLASSSSSSSTPVPRMCDVHICNQEFHKADQARRILEQRQLEGRNNHNHNHNQENGRGNPEESNSSSNSGQKRNTKKKRKHVRRMSRSLRDRYCSSLVSYNHCMKSLGSGCRGNLDYHSVISVVRKMMKDNECDGSHHKSRQGVRTGDEVILREEEIRVKKNREQFRIRRCVQSVINYTFDPETFERGRNSKNLPISNPTTPRLPKTIIRNGNRPSAVHASIYDDTGRSDEDRSSSSGPTLHDELLLQRMMPLSDSNSNVTPDDQEEPRDEEPLICSIFGDPHLRTFGGEFQSCRVLRAWPLVDHPLFAVQVTNSRKEESKNQVSGVTRVTVIVKHFRVCGIEQDLVYEASMDPEDDPDEDTSPTPGDKPILPVEFITGESSTLNSLVKVTPRSEQEVCIQMDHIGVQVCVFHSPGTHFLSVIVKFKKMMTGEERGMMMDAMDSRSLCTSGCPRRDRINVTSILEAVGVDPLPPTGDNSLSDASCSGLQGYYYIACLFDVKMKGATVNDIESHRFCQQMDDISVVKRSLWPGRGFLAHLLSSAATPTTFSSSCSCSLLIISLLILTTNFLS